MGSSKMNRLGRLDFGPFLSIKALPEKLVEISKTWDTEMRLFSVAHWRKYLSNQFKPPTQSAQLRCSRPHRTSHSLCIAKRDQSDSSQIKSLFTRRCADKQSALSHKNTLTTKSDFPHQFRTVNEWPKARNLKDLPPNLRADGQQQPPCHPKTPPRATTSTSASADALSKTKTATSQHSTLSSLASNQEKSE